MQRTEDLLGCIMLTSGNVGYFNGIVWIEAEAIPDSDGIPFLEELACGRLGSCGQFGKGAPGCVGKLIGMNDQCRTS